MSLEVTVLGSSGMFATEHRACSGYLVSYSGMNLWMDAGAGTWRNLLQHVDYPAIDAVLLTHRHIDHTSDVFQAFHARRHGQEEALPSIPLWAPAETLERITGYVTDLEESFDLYEVQAGGGIELEGASLSFSEMSHWAVTVGVRIEHEGFTFAYSSDSGPAGDFERLAHDADLFLCEATLQDADPETDGHLRASQAAEIAAQQSVARVVLTHLPPHRDLGLSLAEAHKNAEGVSLELADDGDRYEVG